MKAFIWVLVAIATVAVIAVVAYLLLFRWRTAMERLNKASAWLDHRWTRIHTLAAPYGIAFSTLLLSVCVADGKWRFWQSWDTIQDAASLGAVFYAVAAISLEVLLTMVFYALGQIHRIMEKRERRLNAIREEGREAERKAWQEWYGQQIASGVQLSAPPVAVGANPE